MMQYILMLVFSLAIVPQWFSAVCGELIEVGFERLALIDDDRRFLELIRELGPCRKSLKKDSSTIKLVRGFQIVRRKQIGEFIDSVGDDMTVDLFWEQLEEKHKEANGVYNQFKDRIMKFCKRFEGHEQAKQFMRIIKDRLDLIRQRKHWINSDLYKCRLRDTEYRDHCDKLLVAEDLEMTNLVQVDETGSESDGSE
jgi:hypothetical protein